MCVMTGAKSGIAAFYREIEISLVIFTQRACHCLHIPLFYGVFLYILDDKIWPDFKS